MDIELKPRLRGVFHQYAFYAALVAGTVLVAVSDSGREVVATWIYAVALAAMFGVSALYHRVNWRSTRVRTWMRRLDHSTILLLIAGTYTPFALLAFDGRIGDVILVVVWCGAAAGLVLNLAWVDAPKWLTALVFIALGWVGVVAVPELLDLGRIARRRLKILNPRAAGWCRSRCALAPCNRRARFSAARGCRRRRALTPGCGSTTAISASPNSASGMPNTAQSCTPGTACSTDSISAG